MLTTVYTNYCIHNQWAVYWSPLYSTIHTHLCVRVEAYDVPNGCQHIPEVWKESFHHLEGMGGRGGRGGRRGEGGEGREGREGRWRALINEY